MSVAAPCRSIRLALSALLLALPAVVKGEEGRSTGGLPASVEVRGVDGRPMILEAPEDGVLAIVFLWTPCPNSNQYSPTLNAIARRFDPDRVRLVGLFVDADRSDAEVAEHATEYALEFPIGRSGAVRLARELGVETVPSAVLIDGEGTVRYQGRIDDQFYDLGRRRQVVRSHDLSDAIAALMAGEEVPRARTEAIGCTLPAFGPED